MTRDVAYYLSRGCDLKAAEYFAGGRKTITDVKPCDGHKLLLTFDNGEQRIYDATNLFTKGSIFNKIAAEKDFERVYLDEQHCISWDIDPKKDSSKDWSNKLDLCPDSCYIDSMPVQKH